MSPAAITENAGGARRQPRAARPTVTTRRVAKLQPRTESLRLRTTEEKITALARTIWVVYLHAWPGNRHYTSPNVARRGGIMDVPVQYYQPVIAIETAVTGVLLFQTHFFETEKDAPGRSGPDPRLRLLMLLILTATVFGSLEAIRERGGLWAAVLVTVGLAISILPILLRVLPPLRRDTQTKQRDPQFWITVLGVILFAAVVAVIVSIN
jgi:hypothetical protein